jgi:TonB family protein
LPDGPVAPSSRLKFPLRDAGVARLVAARDAASVQALLASDVVFGGAWFSDAQCRADFAGAGPVPTDKHPALARCLATLGVQPSPRTSAHPDVALVTSGPFELDVLFGGTVKDPKVRWIGYVSRIEHDDTLPTLTQSAFEALRVEKTPVTLDAATQKKVDTELAELRVRNKPAFAYFKVCIDAQGHVADVRARETSSLVARFAFEQQLQTWTLRPFVVAGTAVPVCSLLAIGTVPEDAKLPPGIPSAHASALHVMPWIFEARQIAGVRAVFPDDEDKVHIQESGTTSIIGIIHYCVTVKGDVDASTLLRSTGFSRYDTKLVEAVKRWRFRPLELDGAPVPACSIAQFVYAQR